MSRLLKPDKHGIPRPVIRQAGMVRPTKDNFHIRWDEALSSDWNRLARNVVVAYIKDALKRDLTEDKIQKIRKAFGAHATTIRKQVRVFEKEEEEKAELQRRRALMQRKSTVSVFALSCLLAYN